MSVSSRFFKIAKRVDLVNVKGHIKRRITECRACFHVDTQDILFICTRVYLSLIRQKRTKPCKNLCFHKFEFTSEFKNLIFLLNS